MFKKTMRVLFVPRTDSPTKAYYGGLVAGLYLGYVIWDLIYDVSADEAFEAGWKARAGYDQRTLELEQELTDSTNE